MARHSVLFPYLATSGAVKSICRWCASLRTLAFRTAIAVCMTAATAAATAACSTLPRFASAAPHSPGAAAPAVLGSMRKQATIQSAASPRAGSAGPTFARTLEPLRDLRSVGDVRGIGLLWAVEFVSDKKSKQPFPAEINFSAKVASTATKRGLLVYAVQGCVDGTVGDHLLIAPPAVITAEEIVWAVQQLRDAAQEVSG